jgi:hypothetical protein
MKQADECAEFVQELQNFINHSVVGRQGTLKEKTSHGELHKYTHMQYSVKPHLRIVIIYTEFTKTKEVLSE